MSQPQTRREACDQIAVTPSETLAVFFFLTAGEISGGAAVHTDPSNINNILSANL